MVGGEGRGGMLSEDKTGYLCQYIPRWGGSYGLVQPDSIRSDAIWFLEPLNIDLMSKDERISPAACLYFSLNFLPCILLFLNFGISRNISKIYSRSEAQVAWIPIQFLPFVCFLCFPPHICVACEGKQMAKTMQQISLEEVNTHVLVHQDFT